MTQEKYESLKADYVEFIMKVIKDFGGLSPAVTVLGIRKDDQKNAVIHIPIPEFLMNSEEGKDEFVDEVIPDIAKRVNKEFDVKAVAWASEAWLRSVAKDEKTGKAEIPEDWKSLPKKEVLFITIESASKYDATVMEMIRKGQQVNAEGQLTDHIELVPLPDFENPEKMEGRFSGLYKKFTTV